MANVTIDMIKALRERTGAGIMDCKNALIEKDGDMEKAVDYLREKGVAKQAKRANRIAAEGLTKVKICGCGSKAIVLEVNCETDFVAKSDPFIKLVDDAASAILHAEPATLEEAAELTKGLFTDAALAVGEKLALRRFVIVKAAEGQGFGSYVHGGGKISVLVLLAKPDEQLGKDLAMHITSSSPIYCSLDDVPAADKERELAIAKDIVAEDPKLQGKPAAMLENIIVKKAEKALQDSCLVLQEYFIDPSKKVGQALKEAGNEVVTFVRYQVGEGIAKEAAAE